MELQSQDLTNLMGQPTDVCRTMYSEGITPFNNPQPSEVNTSGDIFDLHEYDAINNKLYT